MPASSFDRNSDASAGSTTPPPDGDVSASTFPTGEFPRTGPIEVVPIEGILVADSTLGDYEILSEIARGGMGVVYRARQRSLGRIVALKTILEHRLSSTQAVQRFQIEARAAAGLDHPNIVPVFEVGNQGATHFFSMAYIEGCSLRAFRLRLASMPDKATVVGLMGELCDAMDYAYRRGIIHRDLKPENVLVDGGGHVRITDSGLARRLDSDSNLTSFSSVVGTPSYMSPEQAMGGGVPHRARPPTFTPWAASSTSS